MRILTLLHADFEGLGCIAEWAGMHRYTLILNNCYQKETLPSINDFDFLIAMGGPQSACQLEKYPYLQQETALISEAIAHNKHVLGICLGAQLIGTALGATAEKSPHKEIGIFPVELTTAGEQDPIFNQFPNSFPAMHWHNDMPGITKDCTVLAKSEGCPNQAFRFGKRVYGLQFHLEFTQQSAQEILTHAAVDLTPASRYVQSAQEILDADFAALNHRMRTILDTLVKL